MTTGSMVVVLVVIVVSGVPSGGTCSRAGPSGIIVAGLIRSGRPGSASAAAIWLPACLWSMLSKISVSRMGWALMVSLLTIRVVLHPYLLVN